MNIILAPNAFKHALDAGAAAQALARGFKTAGWTGQLTPFPIGDGGTGTGKLLSQHLGAAILKTPVENLQGIIEMGWIGYVDQQQLAIVDLASVNGIDTIQTSEQNPLYFNTYGTGQLIKAALDHGATHIVLCIGGSATIDAGIGIIGALGGKFIDNKGNEITYPKDLVHLAEIEMTCFDKRIAHTTIDIICDVENTLLGADTAIKMFGPQKGASEQDMHVLQHAMQQFNKVLKNFGYTTIDQVIMGGAAGGVAAGLKALAGARLQNGISYFLKITRFDELLNNHQWVITGEGAIDLQTLKGKAPFGAAIAAKEKNLPVIAIGGIIDEGIYEQQHPFDVLFSLSEVFGENNQLPKTEENLEKMGEMIAREILNASIWKH